MEGKKSSRCYFVAFSAQIATEESSADCMQQKWSHFNTVHEHCNHKVYFSSYWLEFVCLFPNNIWLPFCRGQQTERKQHSFYMQLFIRKLNSVNTHNAYLYIWQIQNKQNQRVFILAIIKFSQELCSQTMYRFASSYLSNCVLP